MATNSSRDVKLGIEVTTAGDEGLRDLSGRLRDLGIAAGESTPELDRLAGELDDLAAATKARREAESTARTDATAARTALNEQRDALARLRAETEKASRGTTEYQDAEKTLRLAVVDARIAVRDKAAALAVARTEAVAAATAEKQLADQIRATAAASAVASRTQVQGNHAVTESLKGTLETLRNVAGAALGGTILGSLAHEVADTADSFTNVAAQVRLATGAGAAFDTAFQGVQEIAQRTGASLQNTGTLFARIAQAGREFNLSQGDALALTETINQAVALSGTAAQASDAAITQLIQGLQSGVVRGEEFNSVMEQSPRLARALADGLGVTTGELRKLAEQGALTTEVVIRALQGQSQALRTEFESLSPTVGRAIASLSTAWTVYVGETDKATGASATAAGAIKLLADNLHTVGTVLLEAGKAAAAYQALKLAATFYDAATAARATATATGVATAATIAHTTATVANTTAQAANATAAAGAAARVTGALSGVLAFAGKLGAIGVAVTGVVAAVSLLIDGFKFAGTAIGEGIAKLQGFKDKTDDLVRTAKADEEATRANAAAKAAYAQAAEHAAEKTLGLTAESKALIAEFDGVVKKSGNAAEGLEKVSKGLRLDDLSGIAAAGAALDALGQKGKVSGQQIREALAAALDGKDLVVFETQARAAFDGSEQGARRLKAALDAITTESLRRAGTSAEELATGFSKAANSAINDVDTLARTLHDLGTGSEETGRLLSAALDKALSAAKTERAIQAVIDRFQDLGKQGLLSGEQVAEGMDRARKKIDDLKPGINSLSEALRSFGLKTQEELKATADKLAESYRTISQAVGVSIADKVKAFTAYREAAIAANGGVESSEVALQRSILETKAQAAGLGDAFESSMKRGEAATRKATEAINAQATSLSSVFDAWVKARNSTDLSVLGGNKYDKEGNALDSSGNKLVINGQVKVPEGAVFDQAAFDRAQRSSALSGLNAPNPADYYVQPSPSLKGFTADELAALRGTDPGGFNGSSGYTPLGSYGRQQQAKADAEAKVAAANAAGAAAQAAYVAPAATTSSRVAVDITLNGVKLGTGYASSAAEAATWQVLLAQLAQAAAAVRP
jgi:tape measure domain-containing protein